jgi:predicted GNAT superfamily acetyltransferase
MAEMTTHLRILESPEDMTLVEDIQRQVWTGNETEIVPAHVLLTAIHNGGLAIGAFLDDSGSPDSQKLVGFVFGFPGLYATPDGPRPKHCSHMLGVLPEYRDLNLGYSLKRAQWQMVRHQGLDRITWTFDPLLSRNAYLNISKLGAVCNTYLQNEYGLLRDGLNAGLPSDRFQVDWWVNSHRVYHRLSKRARPPLDLAHYFAGGAEVINPTEIDDMGLAHPAAEDHYDPLPRSADPGRPEVTPLLLVEIPSDYLALKSANFDLALRWRLHARGLFEDLFKRGYLVTDFVVLKGTHPRSFYVLSHGESTL